jgi:hypothetical protein
MPVCRNIIKRGIMHTLCFVLSFSFHIPWKIHFNITHYTLHINITHRIIFFFSKATENYIAMYDNLFIPH